MSGLKWVVANAAHLGIDPARIVVAGESGGGNLTLATGLKLKQDGELGLIKGLYALCPYIRGTWPTAENPSSTENNGILLDLHNNRGAVGYGIEAFEQRNLLAWPSFATAADVEGFPPTVISVNECDPLRDKGMNFYRLLISPGARSDGRCLGQPPLAPRQRPVGGAVSTRGGQLRPVRRAARGAGPVSERPGGVRTGVGRAHEHQVVAAA